MDFLVTMLIIFIIKVPDRSDKDTAATWGIVYIFDEYRILINFHGNVVRAVDHPA